MKQTLSNEVLQRGKFKKPTVNINKCLVKFKIELMIVGSARENEDKIPPFVLIEVS